MAPNSDIKAHALSIVCGRALKQHDMSSMCSMLQVSKHVKAAIISNATHNLATAANFINEHDASVEDMARAMWVAHWLSKYSVLVGELEIYVPEYCRCPAVEALFSLVMRLVQLRHLSVTAQGTCMLLEQANPAHLTSLDVQLQSASASAVVWPLPASLSRLSNLQQLSIGSAPSGNSVPYPTGCFAGLPPRLTQLVVAFKLPDEAYGELPCQLRRLMLTGYNGGSLTHLQQLSALALCHPEGPGQALAAAVNSLTGLRHLTLGLSGALDSTIITAMCDVPSLSDLRVTNQDWTTELMTTAKLTNLTCLVLDTYLGTAAALHLSQMLRPLTQLEKLCFSTCTSSSVHSFGDLFTKHLTKLRCLRTVVREGLQEPLFSQLLTAASGLTSLTLGYLACPDRDLGMIACSAPRLRELTLLCNYMDEEVYPMGLALEQDGRAISFSATIATLSSPHMQHLQCLTLCGTLAAPFEQKFCQDSLAGVRPQLNLQLYPKDTSGPQNYLGCLARHASATVKVWELSVNEEV